MSQRKLLILTTRFFPDPSVGGVRMTNWCRVLPDLGWRPIVLTRYYGHAMTRERLAEQVHPDTLVEYLDHPQGLKGPLPASEAPSQPVSIAAAAASAVPANGGAAKSAKGRAGGGGLRGLVQSLKLDRFMVPDPAILSWWKLRHKALAAARDYQPDVIVTSGPPHSVHEVGLWLRRRLERERGGRVPLVVDFRDPFLMDHRFMPTGPARVVRPLLRCCEKRYYERSDLTLCAIPVHARWARLYFPKARHKIRTLINAAPPSLTAGRIDPIADAQGRPSVRLVGVMGKSELIECARAIQPLVHHGKPVALHLVGPIPQGLDEARRLLGDRLVEVGPVAHDQALRHIAGADVLLNVISVERSKNCGLSSKLFEFLATGKPIIEVNPTQPDKHFLRREPDAVTLTTPNVEELRSAIILALERGSRASALEPNGEGEYRHSWTVRARELVQWLEQLASGEERLRVDRPDA